MANPKSLYDKVIAVYEKIRDKIAVKTDKCVPESSGNFAALDEEGRLIDSRTKAADFASAADTYTKQETDEAINALAAYYITSTPAGDAFATYDALVNASVYYSGGQVRVPTRNDYAIVDADETHRGARWRYIYGEEGGESSDSGDSSESGEPSTPWEPQYPITTGDYEALDNKPSINGIEMSGDVTLTGADIPLDGEDSSESEDQAETVADAISNLDAEIDGKIDKSGGTMTGGLTVPNLTVGSRKPNTTVGTKSVAEGDDVEASGNYSHAEGTGSTASGYASHAEGMNSTASGYASHAEGGDTTASGDYSHAEGMNSTASGYASHAEGVYTKATNQAEHAQGSFNVSHTGGTASEQTLSSIGFGQGSRKNAVETMQDGKTFIYNLGGYDGTNPTNATDVASAVNAKADKSDATLSPVYSDVPTFSKWTILRDGVDVTSQVQQPEYYNIVEGVYGWTCPVVAGDHPPLGFVGINESDALSLAWSTTLDFDESSPTIAYTATRTRTDIIGYTLGSQTDKPLASEAEAEALRTSKANRTELFPAWAANTAYTTYSLVVHDNAVYKCTTAHTSGAEWDSTKWAAATGAEVLGVLLDYEALSSKPPIPVASNNPPSMDGKAKAGILDAFSRSDHVHPSDSSKLDATSAAPGFSAVATYDVGNHCAYNGKLYECVVAKTAPSETTPDHDIYDETTAPTNHWKVTDMTSLWQQGYKLADASSATLTNETFTLFTFAAVRAFATTTSYAIGDTVSYNGIAYTFIMAHTAGEWIGTDAVRAAQVFSLPAVPSGKVGDFVLELDNTANTASYHIDIEEYINLTVNMVVPKGRNLDAMFTVAGGERCELYFTQTAFAVGGKMTWRVIRMDVEAAS